MFISLFPTPFDHFHFHPTLGLDPALIVSYWHCVLNNNRSTFVHHVTFYLNEYLKSSLLVCNCPNKWKRLFQRCGHWGRVICWENMEIEHTPHHIRFLPRLKYFVWYYSGIINLVHLRDRKRWTRLSVATTQQHRTHLPHMETPLRGIILVAGE